MRNTLLKPMFLGMMVIMFISCATSGQSNQLTSDEREKYTILGSVQVIFNAVGGAGFARRDVVNESIKQQAYIKLKEEAQKNYKDNIDIKNIKISYIKDNGGGYWTSVGQWSATGDIVVFDSEKIQRKIINDNLEEALTSAAEQIMEKIAKNSKIAIVYINSLDDNMTEYIADELEFILVSNNFLIVDRSQLDKLRDEQNFQMSGEVDDDTAVSIGKFVGADIIITGSISGIETMRRLRLRALNTQTAQVMAVASERI
jgi:hypothetical protein